MLRNYLIVAWRNLWKNKTFSAINILGLSIGIAAFLLITNYLRFEYSYDDFHLNKDRIYRVPMVTTEKGSEPQSFAFTYPAVAPLMKKDFPEVEEAVRLRRQGGVVQSGDVKQVEDGSIIYVDPAFFKIFSFEFQQGDSKHAMTELNDAVITNETAVKYFGAANPIGKSLRYNNEDYIVKAVLKDIPPSSHVRFNILFSYNKYIQIVKKFGGDAENSWNWSDFYTYVLLKPGTDVQALQSKLPAFVERYAGEDMKKNGYSEALNLQPLKDIHLHSTYDYEFRGNGDLKYLSYLAVAAFFILFIAWINYINLSTSRALDRSREVGIRKVVGAGRWQLIRQFLLESLLINLSALAIGFVIFEISLPGFSSLVRQPVTGLQLINSHFWIFVISVFMIGALLAGLYPAFVLSSFRPIATLKSTASASTSKGGSVLRRSLVVIQFIAAIVLVAGAIGFYQQLNYMSKRDLGVNIRQTLILVQNMDQDSSKIPVIDKFMDELRNSPGVESVTASSDIPGKEIGSSTSFRRVGTENEKRCRLFGIDDLFIPNYHLTLIAGRNFDHDVNGDKVNVILNETAVGVLGFNDANDALGKVIEGGESVCTIVGVVKDYHQESLQYSFNPTIFYPERQNFQYYSLKLNTPDLQSVVDATKQKWSAAFPESPFDYLFLDEFFNNQYRSDRLFSTVLWLFTVLAIIVACLGLFGLSLYTVSKRYKEISIRKVLGATAYQVISLITKDYLLLVLFACTIAVPAAYLLLQNWLSRYAFHVPIGLWFFLLPILLIMMVALSTVSYQSLKAAMENPVKRLRGE